MHNDMHYLMRNRIKINLYVMTYYTIYIYIYIFFLFMPLGVAIFYKLIRNARRNATSRLAYLKQLAVQKLARFSECKRE